MDQQLAAVPVVAQLAAAVDDLVIGLYVGGSVATGDYRPGVSDIDVVALMDRTPNPEVRRAIVAVHRGLIDESPEAVAVHCVYVPRDDAGDPLRKQWTWAFEELFRRLSVGSPARSCSPTRWSSPDRHRRPGCLR